MGTLFLRGLHYKNLLAYNLITFLKLRTQYYFRYRIASQYIKEGDSILDVCSGAGRFREFLPKRCKFECIEASPEFIAKLNKKNIKNNCINLHEGIKLEAVKVDVIVMIISLWQFRNTSVHVLLEDFKKIAKRVIIVEDVMQSRNDENFFIGKIMNYLCTANYYFPIKLFSVDEFEDIMREHNYKYRKYSRRYVVGCYDC